MLGFRAIGRAARRLAVLAPGAHLSRQVDFIAEHHQPLAHSQGSHRLKDYPPRRANVLAVLLESLVKQCGHQHMEHDAQSVERGAEAEGGLPR